MYWNRGVDPFRNNPLAKETFVNFEYLIEEEIGKARIEAGEVKAYKGTPKKW